MIKTVSDAMWWLSSCEETLQALAKGVMSYENLTVAQAEEWVAAIDEALAEKAEAVAALVRLGGVA